MFQGKRRIDVMVSSTSRDLGEHRRNVGDIITRMQFVPRIMDLDATTGKDGITYSLDLVDEADIYILILAFRYGHVPKDPRNPEKLSMTQLEFERALERAARGELRVLPFMMACDHKQVHQHTETEAIAHEKLQAFREKVQQRQVSFFHSIDELEKQVLQALNMLDQPGASRNGTRHDIAFMPHEGETLDGRYVFEKKLGQRNNGVVWRVREYGPDDNISRTAVIKLLTPEVSAKPDRVACFKREITNSFKLIHPNIIRTMHWGTVGKQLFAVMEYIDGITLREFMSGRHFNNDDTVRYLSQIAEALDFAHRQGIVHRGVKPENIIVARDRLYLGDFGMVASPDADNSQTVTDEWVKEKRYLAPEQWDYQPVVPQTDIYALGIIAYEMLTGEFPYDASSHLQLLKQHVESELPPQPNLAGEILHILRRASAKDLHDRYDSATEFITELHHWQLDPANVETEVEKYLTTLRNQRRMAAFEKLFVDLEGEVREVMASTGATQHEDASQEHESADDLDELIELFMVDLDADHHEPQQTHAQYVPDVVERLAESDRIVLVGEPGSGKSFTLGRLVLYYIAHYDTYHRIPVFVALNAFKGEMDFIRYVKQQMGALAVYYDELQAEKRLVLICDALNEMPRTADSNGRNLVAEVRETLGEAQYFVVSCRMRDYRNDLDSLGLERLQVRDLDLPAIHKFVKTYLRENAASFWQRIGGSDDLYTYWHEVREAGEAGRFWQNDSGVASYTSVGGDKAWRTMWRGAKLIPLARNPYMARVLCTLHKRQDLPDNRANLYQAFVGDLYERELKHATARGQQFPERERFETFLTGLALRMHNARTTTLKREAIIEDQDLLRAALDATMLVRDGDDIRFAHQLLQEYFTASTVALKMYAKEDSNELLGDSWWQLNIWRETALMVAEFTDEVERAAHWFGEASPPLAIEILQRLGDDPSLQDISADLRRLLIDTSLRKIDPVVEPNVAARAAAGQALSILVDPRPGVGVKDGLPDIVWVEIPAGTFILGSDKTLDPQTYEDELERCEVSLPRFYIAKHSTTNAQFRAFINAGGYDNPKFWTHKGWQWRLHLDRRQPAYFDDSAYNRPNYPVNGVAWYEAFAFARWLDKTLQDRPDSTMRVQLPTEVQWERAARGTDGRIYPYGEAFDPAKGNVDETGLGTTVAVGLFPNGAAPDGVQDMSGNVYDWCVRNWHEDFDEAEDDLGEDLRVIVRGGSFVSLRAYARTSYRYDYTPSNWSYNWGFRCVLSSPQVDGMLI